MSQAGRPGNRSEVTGRLARAAALVAFALLTAVILPAGGAGSAEARGGSNVRTGWKSCPAPSLQHDFPAIRRIRVKRLACGWGRATGRTVQRYWSRHPFMRLEQLPHRFRVKRKRVRCRFFLFHTPDDSTVAAARCSRSPSKKIRFRMTS